MDRPVHSLGSRGSLSVTASGDKTTDAPLAQSGGKGLFIQEIETELLAGRIDPAACKYLV